jgi:cyclic pyranopterin phosphate synthase
MTAETTLASPRDTLGRPMRDLRISVTDRCNFRCTYCMPAEIFGDRYEFLPRADLLSFEEIYRLVRVFGELGVRKVRITGGEPLLRHDLPKLIAQIAPIEAVEDFALTTNATLLRRQAGALKDAGLDRLTISLDSLDEAVFNQMNGGKLDVATVLDGIAAAEEAGFENLKINCVAQKGVNDHTLADLASHFRGSGHIVRFIEYMDVGTRNGWNLDEVIRGEEIAALIDAVHPIEPADPNYRGEVAKRWRYKDGGGEIGIITSVSRPFCGDCSRMRLTTDGKLVTCLFASGGFDLRAPLRDGASDAELRELIAGVWGQRTDRYSEERGAATPGGESGEDAARRIEMYQIGG